MLEQNVFPNPNVPKHQAFAGDFRLFLLSELTRRARVNPAFSLRAFARLLGVESSRLSKILRGHRPVGAKLIPRLAQKLGLSQPEIDGFVESAPGRKNGANKKKEESPAATRAYKQLSQDTFEMIENWQHYAILEMMKLKDFENDLKWIAKALKISVNEARENVERLQRVGLLDIKEDGTWVDISDGFSTHLLPENETSYAHKRSEKALLALASEVIDSTPLTHRDQSSMMMATSTAKIAEAKRRIQKFRRELCEFLEDTDDKNAVYQMTISIFPLTPTDKESGSKK